MFGSAIGSIPADPRWGYDDPSGVPDTVSVTMHLPEPLLESVCVEAARTGVKPSSRLLDLVERTLHPRPTAA